MCDMFSVYLNQGIHRERFYKKQDYYIDEIEFDAQDKKKMPIIEDIELKKCKNIKDIIKTTNKKKKKKQQIQEDLESCMICLSD